MNRRQFLKTMAAATLAPRLPGPTAASLPAPALGSEPEPCRGFFIELVLARKAEAMADMADSLERSLWEAPRA